MSPEERQGAAAALTAEFGLLMTALGGVWSASLLRTSVFFGALSAAGVALGFAAQTGVERMDFIALAVVVLLVVLFLGITTFVRLVQYSARRSLAEIHGAIRPLSSTPADELGVPF